MLVSVTFYVGMRDVCCVERLRAVKSCAEEEDGSVAQVSSSTILRVKPVWVSMPSWRLVSSTSAMC